MAPAANLPEPSPEDELDALDLAEGPEKASATVTVVREKCQGYTNCVVAAPNVFDMDDDNIATVLDPRPIGDDLVATRRAVRLCPVDAILLDDSGSGR